MRLTYAAPSSQQRIPKAEIARRVGVNRRTVYHWIETGQLDRELDAEPVRYGGAGGFRRSWTRTKAGRQGQVDFAEFVVPWGKRHALVVVLGYSRMLWLQYYERQTMETVVRGLEAAFAFFGGVPSELLFDQMRAGGCWRTGSFCASAPTGASASGRAGRAARRRRGRWSDRSATCAAASSTVGSSSPTTISTLGPASGSTRWPTSGPTAR